MSGQIGSLVQRTKETPKSSSAGLRPIEGRYYIISHAEVTGYYNQKGGAIGLEGQKKKQVEWWADGFTQITNLTP